jgi:hypothetical protein
MQLEKPEEFQKINFPKIFWIGTLGFKKNGNCQKNFCQILLNFSSLKQPFRN